MKIDTIGFKYNDYSVKKSEPVFCSSKHVKKCLTRKDVFFNNANFPFLNKNITEIRKGKYGTVCKGSRSLPQFFSLFKSRNAKDFIIKKGLSTNTTGNAFALLKSSADVPLSTSFVHSCSVMYLYNGIAKTHFLYHIFDEANESELKELIKIYMPEGFTSAAIVPGDKTFVRYHQQYLPDVYYAIRHSNQDAKIQVFHDSSEKPEIVGYQGRVFEIPNVFYKKSLADRSYIANQGQATFKIQDIRTYDIANELAIDSIDDLINLKSEIHKKYNKYIAQIIEKLIDDRIEHITKLKSFKSLPELEDYIESQHLGYPLKYNLGIPGYYYVINDQRKILS